MEQNDPNANANPVTQNANLTAKKEEAAQFAELNKDKNKSGFTDENDFGMILDIPVTISLEVGKTSISIKNLLQLSQGSVVELDRNVGQPLDVLVNGTLIAHADVVVVNEKYAIKLVDVVSKSERVEMLK